MNEHPESALDALRIVERSLWCPAMSSNARRCSAR